MTITESKAKTKVEDLLGSLEGNFKGVEDAYPMACSFAILLVLEVLEDKYGVKVANDALAHVAECIKFAEEDVRVHSRKNMS